MEIDTVLDETVRPFKKHGQSHFTKIYVCLYVLMYTSMMFPHKCFSQYNFIKSRCLGNPYLGLCQIQTQG